MDNAFISYLHTMLCKALHRSQYIVITGFSARVSSTGKENRNNMSKKQPSGISKENRIVKADQDSVHLDVEVNKTN